MRGKAKMSKDVMKVDIGADWLSVEVSRTVYSQGKAKIFNLLESQISPEIPLGQNIRLDACKRIVEDILSNISRDVSKLINDTLGDWKEKVEFGGEVSDEDIKEATKEYEEILNVLRK